MAKYSKSERALQKAKYNRIKAQKSKSPRPRKKTKRSIAQRYKNNEALSRLGKGFSIWD